MLGEKIFKRLNATRRENRFEGRCGGTAALEVRQEQVTEVCAPCNEPGCVHRTQMGDIKEETWLSCTIGRGGGFGKINSEKAQKVKFPNF